MIRLFISLPMNGKSSEQINIDMMEAFMRFKTQYANPDEEISLIQTNIYLGEDATPLEYLAESLRLMSYADVVFFVKGWNENWSRGCYIEYLTAHLYDKKIIDEK